MQMVLKQPMCLHCLQQVAPLFHCNLYCITLACISIQYYCNTSNKQGYYYYLNAMKAAWNAVKGL